MNMSIRAAFLCLVGAVLLATILPMATIVIVDPALMYHKPVFRSQHINGDLIGVSAAGMIHNYLADPSEGFDSIVIGNSTSVNYTSQMMREYFGWTRAMNLSIPGTNPDHHQMILEAALREGHIKHVFIEMSYHYALKGYTTTSEPTFPSDDFTVPALYDSAVWNDKLYLFSSYAFFEALKIIVGDTSAYQGSIDAPARWGDREDLKAQIKNKELPGNIEEIITKLHSLKTSNLQQLERKHRLSDFEYSYFDLRLAAPLLKYCNKDIDFILNFSPRPIMEWLTNETAIAEFNVRRYAVNTFSGCGNIKIYAEDQYVNVISRPDSFFDVVHYSPALSEFILGEISANRNQLNVRTIDEYEQRVMANIRGYDSYLRELLLASQKRDK